MTDKAEKQASNTAKQPILPGATIGIFGGGQLGRMTAMAARAMGYRIQVLDPDPACPARFVVDGCIEAAWDDVKGAVNLARGCDGSTTVTVEGGSTMSIQDMVDACSDHYSNRRRLTDTRCREYARILDDYNNGRIGPRHCD